MFGITGSALSFVASVWIVGFGGPALKEKGRQQDVQTHLQKFAFPILEDCLAERPTPQVFRKPDSRLLMFLELFVVVEPSRNRLGAEKEQEKANKNQRESVVAPEPAERR